MATLNYAFKELSCKIVYYGCGLCGKTTNLIHIHKTVPQKFRGELVSLATEQDRTLFFDFLPLDLGEVKGFKTKFQLYTVPGQVYYNATRKLVLRGVDGLVFVADSQRDRFQENIDSLENLKQNLSEYGYRLATGPTDFEGVPWVIQYNKRDMPHVSSLDEMQEVLNPDGVPCFEAVAVTGQGVKDTLKGISTLVIKKLNAGTTSAGEGLAAQPKPGAEERKPVGAGAAKAPSSDDYGEMSESELENEPEQAPAPTPMGSPAPAQTPTPEPVASGSQAAIATGVAGAPPSLNLVQKGKAILRGMGMGSSHLFLQNIPGEDPTLFQLTGKVSFLLFFGSTWSRKLRYQGLVEKEQEGITAKYLSFLSADDTAPILEVYVRDDFNKALYIDYLGALGQVQIVPPGKKPLS